MLRSCSKVSPLIARFVQAPVLLVNYTSEIQTVILQSSRYDAGSRRATGPRKDRQIVMRPASYQSQIR